MSSSTSKIGAYGFDLDGTLVTIPVQWEEVRENLRRMSGCNLEFRPFFKDLETVISERPGKRDELFGMIDGYELRALESMKVNDGTVEMLTALSPRVKLSLVTMQGRKACDAVLERLGIRSHFHSTFTREDSLDRAKQLRMAIESIGPFEGHFVFVGDRVNDLEAARKNGVRFAMIRTLPDTPPADVVFRSVAEFRRSPWVTDLAVRPH